MQSWESGNYPLIEHEYDAIVVCVLQTLDPYLHMFRPTRSTVELEVPVFVLPLA